MAGASKTQTETRASQRPTFAGPVEASGLLRYVYQPPKTAMGLEDWPTLGEMILAGKRVVAFIDYNVNMKRVP